MEKPVVFVSHAAVDAEIATAFKVDAESSFLGLCHLFVSSNLDSLSGGSEWIKEIKTNLENARILVGLLSPIAVERPWIYFEFGAGWIRSIPTVAVCHSGLAREQLPVPLSHFQALNLLDELHLRHLYEQISSAIGCQLPPADYSGLTSRYKQITEVHRRARVIREWYWRLLSWNPGLHQLSKTEEHEVLIPAEADAAFRDVQVLFGEEGFLQFESRGFSMGTRVGIQATNWIARKGPRYQETLDSLSSVK
jgi:hypothetical protein